MRINFVELDLLEHLFYHVRNLSISLPSTIDFSVKILECFELTRLNGYEKAWTVEDFKLENHLCGFMIENANALKSLNLQNVRLSSFSDSNIFGFKLRNLHNLVSVTLNHNQLIEINNSMFEGAFEELIMLNLSNNLLTEVNMSIFKLFPKLKTLDLSYNLIQKIQSTFMPNDVHVIVDFNRFDCQWLIHNFAVASKHFLYRKEYQALNLNGLECTFHYQQCEACPSDNLSTIECNHHSENFIFQPKIFLSIVCGSILLGGAITYITLYVRTRIRLLKQQPFYHMLRNSMSVVARDFKGIVWRNLPPTNYEQPISDSNLNMTSEMDTGNIYEEIPSQQHI